MLLLEAQPTVAQTTQCMYVPPIARFAHEKCLLLEHTWLVSLTYVRTHVSMILTRNAHDLYYGDTIRVLNFVVHKFSWILWYPLIRKNLYTKINTYHT